MSPRGERKGTGRRGGGKRSAAARAPAEPLILVVDDFQDNREMYADFFAFSGYRVAQAADGVEALERAYALTPDLIVMDLSLPGLDGWEATRRLKGDPRTRHIPVIAVTGHALAGHSQRAAEAGCDAFVTKPCLPEELVARVRTLLEATRAHK
jgi:CheY-like chemotaxis protein